ncbi:alpha- and gamma-adaptin-binding protein p34-like isoform X2 [Mercenaria mercenaria]|uniref:alpha- and gamma-adaptin-binding protein p34-like isoform X2 n=1 Tax=Mercenaria mercenaria TaxID=6596 RepID=UPI00234E67C6|nr:alpha- and gamma-adaptin-binding protein p34-like isoform X2 [Mercenaria mercenaria]
MTWYPYILKVESLPEGNKVIENIVSYDWRIDTKYYTADVRLCLTKERTIGDEEFAESVQAFVVHFDAEKKESFESVKLWNAYLKEINPEIKMLVCDRCSENSAVGRLETQTWCIDNAFELVELNPEADSDSETEDDFKETTGIKRIVQSLHAHTWPNLDLKEDHHVVSPFMRQLMKEEHNAKQLNNETNDNSQSTERTDSATGENLNSESKTVQNDRLCTGNLSVNNSENKHVTCDNLVTERQDKNSCDSSNKDVSEGSKQEGSEGACGASGDGKKETSKKKAKKPSKEERLDSLLPAEDMALFEALGNEDPGGESFEKLFEKFAHMKEKANCLPPQERKKYAENVAIAFWRAIGGDEDEIGDLDSD